MMKNTVFIITALALGLAAFLHAQTSSQKPAPQTGHKQITVMAIGRTWIAESEPEIAPNGVCTFTGLGMKVTVCGQYVIQEQ